MNFNKIHEDKELHQLNRLIRETPIEVDLIEKTMRRYQNKKNKRRRELKPNWIKVFHKVIIATAFSLLLFGCLFSASYISPTMAAQMKQIPGMASIFQLAGDFGLKTADEKGLLLKLNESDTHNGLTLSVPAVMYDGIRVSIGIERQTKEKEFLREDLGTLISNVDMAIDGNSIQAFEPNNSNSIGIYMFPSQDTDSVIIEFSDLRNQGGIPLREHFNLTLTVTVNGINEAFILDIPVKKNTEDYLVFNPNISKLHDNFIFMLANVEFTPITTSITTRVSLLENTKISLPIQSMGIHIFDDQGHQLKFLGGNGWNETDGTTLIYDYRFEPFKTMPKTVTIKPYMHLFKDQNKSLFQLNENGEPKIMYLPDLEVTIPVDKNK